MLLIFLFSFSLAPYIGTNTFISASQNHKPGGFNQNPYVNSDYRQYLPEKTTSFEIGFNKNKLGMMIIADNLGQTTRIDFSSVQKNTALSASFFNFDIPKNIDIFDERK